ncbi:hypothetical protein HDV00_006502 [Rhizophlyctis rosea]|nr:hypothetical protein HDV00_006502 [Rhizophlyctis rosea]
MVPPVLPRRKWLPHEDKQLLDLLEQCKKEGRKISWYKLSHSIGRTQRSIAYRAFALDPCKRQGAFTGEEDALIVKGVSDHLTWAKIGESLRCWPTHVRRRWTAVLDPSIKREPWSAEEDETIRKAVGQAAQFRQVPKWEKVAQQMNRGANDIKSRWWNILHPHVRWGGFARWEDDAIRKEVQAAQTEGRRINWANIGRDIGRTGCQVQRRWTCRLDPSIKRGSFTPEEDAVIIQERRNGSSWRTIGKLLGRSYTSVCNRFNQKLNE